MINTNETRRLESKIPWWRFFKSTREAFRAPEIKNRLHFDFSNFFKLETCKNLYKIFLVKLIAMIDLIFWLELHYKKATLQKTALFSKICKKR